MTGTGTLWERSGKGTTPYSVQRGNEKENRSKQLLRCDSWSDGAKDDNESGPPAKSPVFGQQQQE